MPVSVLRSRLPGSCSGHSCVLTVCCVVPIRCLGFSLVLLPVPGAVICCCLLCILPQSSDVLASGPAVWPGCICICVCICIWSRSWYLVWLHPVYSIISVAVSVWSCLWSGHIPGLILSPASCACPLCSPVYSTYRLNTIGVR